MLSMSQAVMEVNMFAHSCLPSRRFAIPALLFGLAAIVSPGPALGRNWLVLNDGSGDAPTIQAAVDSAAAAGDSIFVGPGKYAENVLINGKGLVISSLEGRDQTLINGTVAAITLSGNGTKKIVGLTLQANKGADGEGTFESCEFSFCSGIGATVAFGRFGRYTSCLFTANGTGFFGYGGTFVDCEIRGNGAGAVLDRGSFTDCDISENGGTAVETGGDFPPPTMRITNCNISGNGWRGIQGTAFGGFNSLLVECTETKISDNGNGGFFGNGIVTFTMADCEISENDGPAGWAFSSLTRCVVWGNAGGLTSPGADEFAGGVTLVESTYHANGEGIRADPRLGDPGRITVNRSIVSGTLVGRGIPQCSSPSVTLSVECSDIFGNAGGDVVCQAAGPNNFTLDPLFCDAAGGDFTLAENSPCAPANSPAGCNLIGALPVGCQILGIEPAASPQLHFGVGQNRPNPFNPSTVIDFTLPVAMPVALRIYDASGRLVRTLVDGALEAGNHIAVWDGREASGSEAASGIYYYRIEGEGYGVVSRKMMLVK
jgi:FlgD Ig-like domain